MLCRIILSAVVDEFRQCFRSPHIRRFTGPGRDSCTRIPGEIQYVVGIVWDIADPAVAASCIKEQVVPVVVQTGLRHFIDVLCGRAVSALQVRSYNIDHHCIVFGPVLFRFGLLRNCAVLLLRGIRIEFIGVRIRLFLRLPVLDSPVIILFLVPADDLKGGLAGVIACPLFLCGSRLRRLCFRPGPVFGRVLLRRSGLVFGRILLRRAARLRAA